jgi:RsiW-degrading membrane proteinase PrsW (M82 family)
MNPTTSIAVRRRRLPAFLSPPVVVCSVASLGLVGYLAVVSPWSVVAGLIPLVIVLPVLGWLDRIEPEPRSSRAHALLWGASVAIVVAGVVNTVVGVLAGEIAAIVVSAPVVEEIAKALGVVWAVRRGEVDGVSDGIVFAGWVALGFAVVEDMTYFAIADGEGAFASTVVLRAFLTPFAHPLFTFWTGLAIGSAVRRGRRIGPSMVWGLVLAIATHAVWNGSLVFADVTYTGDEATRGLVVLAAIGLFVCLFVAVGVALVVIRRSEERRFMAAVPGLILRYSVSPHEAAWFVDWRSVLRHRRALPRRQRRHFDRLHASLARLSVVQPGTEREQRLTVELRDSLERCRRTRA